MNINDLQRQGAQIKYISGPALQNNQSTATNNQNKSDGFSFLGNVKNALVSRFDKSKDIMSNAGIGTGKFSYNPVKQAEAGYQVAGQTAGFINDVIGAGVSAIIGQKGREKVGSIVKSVSDMPPVQEAIKSWGDFKQKHPEAAINIESTINLASLLYGAKGSAKLGSAAAKGAEAGVGATGKLLETTGGIVESSGKKVFESAIPLSKGEAGMVQAYRAKNPLLSRLKNAADGSVDGPVTSAKTAYDTGLYGTKSSMGVQAVSKAKEIWSQTIDPALTGIKERVNMKELFSKVESDIKQVADISARKSRLKALSAIKDDYKNVSNLSYRQLQDIKSKLTEFIPEKAYRGDNITGAYNDVRKTLSDEMRKMIYQKISPEAKRAYLDYGNLKNIQELGKTALTKAGFKGGSGTLLSEIYARASDPLKTIGGKTIGVTGKKIKNAGKRLLLSAKK